jgi:hypothetical protein
LHEPDPGPEVGPSPGKSDEVDDEDEEEDDELLLELVPDDVEPPVPWWPGVTVVVVWEVESVVELGPSWLTLGPERSAIEGAAKPRTRSDETIATSRALRIERVRAVTDSSYP